MNRMFHPTFAAGWSTALALALSSGVPAAAADEKTDNRENIPLNTSFARDDIDWKRMRRGELAVAAKLMARAATLESANKEDHARTDVPVTTPKIDTAGDAQSVTESAANSKSNMQLAQFQLPPPANQGEMLKRYPERPFTQYLNYQYSIGSESEMNNSRNPDLNNQVADSSFVLLPQVNGIIIYRPTRWLTTTLEMIFDREIPVQEHGTVVLPSGETQFAQPRHFSLLVDQAFVSVKEITAPFEFSIGRRDFQDERHFLYDTSMDMASVGIKLGPFRAEVSGGRQVKWDLDLLQNQPTDSIDTYMLITDYRGIEDIKLTGYVIRRNDRSQQQGNPLLYGLNVEGMPSDQFSFWSLIGFVGGTDQAKQKFAASAFDIGGTYRFRDLPYSPNFTVGFAYASGDGDPNDNRDTQFQQTGLQSNEVRLAGLAKFKYYGETLDSELSNLKIFTVGFGFRPLPNISVDLLYHRYLLDKIADSILGSSITALMNQNDAQLSKDMGSEFDTAIGIRNLFGLRRLGIDLRMGIFFPGRAFKIEGGDPANPSFRPANKAASIFVKYWY